MIIRDAHLDDAPRLREIFAPYVEQTAITFEYDVPTLEEFRQRMEAVLRSYPYFVAIDEGRIVGYAYAGRFKQQAAYRWAVETSIYVDRPVHRRGVGRMLHEALEEALRQRGILNMNACIAYLDQPDEYLPLDSVHFHERMGYTRVAHFHRCGRKFGRWYDMIWMEKLIDKASYSDIDNIL